MKKDKAILMIKEILQRRAPAYLNLVDEFRSNSLKDSEKAFLCDLINDEFMEVGIKEDFSPSKLGLDLESLLDAINSH